MEELQFVKVSGPGLAETLAALAKEIWQEYYPALVGREQVEYMLDRFQSRDAVLRQIRQEGYLYYLFRLGQDRWIGYCGVVPGPDGLFLSKLYLAQEYRHQGFGRSALVFIEEIARAKGLGRIYLTVNKKNSGSIQAYEKLGFVRTAELVTEIGAGFRMDDYRMEKAVF